MKCSSICPGKQFHVRMKHFSVHCLYHWWIRKFLITYLIRSLFVTEQAICRRRFNCLLGEQTYWFNNAMSTNEYRTFRKYTPYQYDIDIHAGIHNLVKLTFWETDNYGCGFIVNRYFRRWYLWTSTITTKLQNKIG